MLHPKTLLTGLSFVFAVFMCAYVANKVFEAAQQKAPIRHIDSRTIYVSGLCWLTGQSPYNVETFTQMWNQQMHQQQFQPKISQGQVVFLYPPSLGIIAIPLALLSWETAQAVWDLINVLALIAMALFSALLLRKLHLHWGKIGLGIGFSIWGQMSYILAVIVLGQTALLVTAATLAAFYWAWQRYFWLAALSIVIASIKPQISFLPIIYLLIITQSGFFWLISIVLVMGTQLLLLITILDTNPGLAFLRSLILYQAHSANTPLLLPGLHSIMAHMGIQPYIMSALPIIGITLTILLALAYLKNQPQQSAYQHLLSMTLILTLCAVVMPIHHYDYTLFFVVMMLIVVVRPLSAWLALLPGLLLLAQPLFLSGFISDTLKTPVPTLIIASVAALYLMIVLTRLVVLQRHVN
ncbi:MAG: glycosyltransferase family 87 protein [Pseudomonadota bacterium]|nr:glycosyltransferase family 87 protein [Pseudomonadota bacterium]